MRGKEFQSRGVALKIFRRGSLVFGPAQFGSESWRTRGNFNRMFLKLDMCQSSTLGEVAKYFVSRKHHHREDAASVKGGWGSDNLRRDLYRLHLKREKLVSVMLLSKHNNPHVTEPSQNCKIFAGRQDVSAHEDDYLQESYRNKKQ